ncbi:DNA ligase D [Pseudomonas duriflava]|uniref:DNA ligase D n=1 Tax=Pseudomonas duriflava TaxID=459528 RepID=A0A562Q2R4_9PSED|nr:non-homologous end-joining DNA ligase [Pseudomonas duriflava]TWI50942.1 DNA ligase D [Pseudomonas duriflava]
MANPLSEYTRKRRFNVTSEPAGQPGEHTHHEEALQFVIQKHDASHLHYDFRLELEGTLKSWAVPKGPSLDPSEKRLAVQVEDHPIEYGTFEGSIPEGEYGGGDVIVWDRGTWIPTTDPIEGYADGKLKFELRGKKLNGRWALVRTRLRGNASKPQWLLIKERDDAARSRSNYDVTEAEPDSVLSDKTLPNLARRTKTSPTTSRNTATAKPTARKAKEGADVAGIHISHPERVIDPSTGITKLKIAQYYERIASWILPHLQDRPVALVRTPEGIQGEQIFQKHKQTLAIPHIRELDPSFDPGHAPLMTIETVEALLGTAQMGTIELHTWNAAAPRIDRPDRMIFDLDPDPTLSWASMLEATQLLLTVLDELELQAFLKTSGGKGVHIVVPLDRRQTWDDVKAFAEAIALHMAMIIPERFSAKMGARNRMGRIFIDYLRNRAGATTVSAYSLRARPGLGVSVPISREELPQLQRGDQWTLNTVFKRLETLHNDPWKGYDTVRQSLTAERRRKLGMR